MTTKQYYECHITMEGDSGVIKPIVEEGGWIFSKIDGDPELGMGVKCYATTHINKRFGDEEVIKVLKKEAEYLRARGVEVVREKVELVIYDKRSKP